jgi:hypothetical protein
MLKFKNIINLHTDYNSYDTHLLIAVINNIEYFGIM